MARTTRLIALAMLTLALAACGEEEVVEPQGDDSRMASGEVLEGTISDDMIPLEQLRSQAPPLRVAPTGAGGDAVPSAGNSVVEGEVSAEAAPPIEAPVPPVIAAEPVLETAPPPTPAPAE